jgi:hypothetical protein
VTALRLSPLTFVGLLVLAGACIARGRGSPLWGSSAARHAAVLAGYVALFTVMMTASPKKLDRYLLPAYPALVILGALGLWLLIQRWVPSRLRWPTVAALGACQVALIASVQPYPLSFYNPLLGGGMVAQEAMIVGWGEGLDQVAEYLNGQPNASQIVVVSLYKDQIVPLFPGGGARLEDWRRGNYLATYINMDQRNLLPGPLSELVATTPPEFTVRINGIRYARVYRISPEIRNQSGSQPGPRPNAVPRP